MAQAPLKVRNVSPLLQKVRNFLLGREHTVVKSGLRYTPLVSKRDQAPPILPDGEAHALSANHYALRDGRREAAPPIVIVEGGQRVKLIEGGSGGSEGGKGEVAKTGGVRTPGKIFRWD